MRYYYLYEIKIDNPLSKLNGCYYYGKHSTSNLKDNYFGSGKIITSYRKKYGINGLIKTILQYFNNENELNEAERILIKNKKEELKDKCINLNDGGYGSFTYINSLYTKEDRSRIMMNSSTQQQRHERAVLAGEANKKRLEDPKNLKDFKEKIKKMHADMSPEEKIKRYEKVSESLKRYYGTDKGKKELQNRILKNKETNKKVATQWREDFVNMVSKKKQTNFLRISEIYPQKNKK